MPVQCDQCLRFYTDRHAIYKHKKVCLGPRKLLEAPRKLDPGNRDYCPKTLKITDLFTGFAKIMDGTFDFEKAETIYS